MAKEKGLIGCFISGPSVLWDATEAEKQSAASEGELFRKYIWGDDGLDNRLKGLKNATYGQDVVLILFEFILKPLPLEVAGRKSLESYRKKEKSIGLTLFIDDRNFFKHSADRQPLILGDMILEKLTALSNLIRKKKLDTNIERLEQDIKSLMSK